MDAVWLVQLVLMSQPCGSCRKLRFSRLTFFCRVWPQHAVCGQLVDSSLSLACERRCLVLLLPLLVLSPWGSLEDSWNYILSIKTVYLETVLWIALLQCYKCWINRNILWKAGTGLSIQFYFRGYSIGSGTFLVTLQPGQHHQLWNG